MDIKREIEKNVKEFLDAKVDKTPNIDMGDYCINVFKLAKEMKKNPKEIAEEIAKKLKEKNILGVEDIKVFGGYINFYLDYFEIAKYLDTKFEKKNKKIILEHTSANPNGPLHIGHLRNAIIGDSLKRIFKFYGYDVETHYYVNDMGRQMALVVLGLEKFTLDKEKKKDHAIAEIYIEINKLLEENKELEDEIKKLMVEYENSLKNNIENEITKKYKFAVEYCLDGIKETLNNLNIEHDVFVWESNYIKNGLVYKILEMLKETGKVEEEGNVLKLNLEDFGIEKRLVLTREDGTTLYTTRDIAYHFDKIKKGKCIDVLGADHKLTAEMLKCALKLLNSDVPEIVFYEFISLPEGSMSTRRGRFISTDEFLEEAYKRALEECKKRNISEDIAKKIAVGAVRFNIVKVSPEKSFIFKWEDALDFEKSGSPFIQYAYVRCIRLLEKDKGELKKVDLCKEEKELIKQIYEFRYAVEEVVKNKKPSLLANYLIELAKIFNKFYEKCPILKESNEDLRKFRLYLVEKTKNTLETGLNLLGIECPERM